MFDIIIPARFNSSRLPGKLLMEIKGKTLLERVHERALICGARNVVIATDDDRIEAHAKAFGANICRTKSDHKTGTDRLAEAVHILGLNEEDIIVNLQGDEPLVPVSSVQKLVLALKKMPAYMATLCTPIQNHNQLMDPNVVKVVLDKNNYALYFSRAAVPFHRDAKNPILEKAFPYYRHIGLYAYTVRSLKHYQTLSSAPIEAIEQLEQLRILWQGEKIHVSLIDEVVPPGVDTLAELEAIQEYF